MMSREAMKLALEALEEAKIIGGQRKADKAIDALREALAEQPARPYRQLQDNGSKYFGESWDKAEQPAQQEPVAWMYPDDHERMLTNETFCTVYSVEVGSATRGESTVALYTSPPAQRTWVGLTPEELDEMFSKTLKGKKLVNWVAQAIEAKLKEKNT